MPTWAILVTDRRHFGKAIRAVKRIKSTDHLALTGSYRLMMRFPSKEDAARFLQKKKVKPCYCVTITTIP